MSVIDVQLVRIELYCVRFLSATTATIVARCFAQEHFTHPIYQFFYRLVGSKKVRVVTIRRLVEVLIHVLLHLWILQQ